MKRNKRITFDIVLVKVIWYGLWLAFASLLIAAIIQNYEP